MTRRRFLALGLLGAVPASVAAEHEIQYRYTVLGFATDAKGRPRRGQTVKLVRYKTGFAYLGQTDEGGFYLIVSRLGDESAGERITLTVGSVVVPLTARFDPRNHGDERGTRIDVVAGRAVERAAWFPSTLKRFLSAR